MKQLRFQELALVSEVERRGRRIRFHPTANVIRGANGTGKSSLVKSLYWAMGAEPANILGRWKEANVTALLKFSVDEDHFRMIRAGRMFFLFDSQDGLIRSFDGVTAQLAPFLADLFDFHLTLAGRGTDTQAVPALLFLPFYLDQDVGWSKPHDSFANLGQFVNARKDALEFHTGIRPSAYYVAKSRQRQAELAGQPLRAERGHLQRIDEDLRARVETANFDIDISAYQEEVERLLGQCNRLKAVEEGKKLELVLAYETKRFIDEQKAVVTDALSQLKLDREFSASVADPITCPTCRASYPNGFSERFEIAVDETTCLEMLTKLATQEIAAGKRLQEAREEAADAEAMTQEIEDLLNTRRGEVALADLLRLEGRKEISQEISSKIEAINSEIGALDEISAQASEEMDALSDAKRKKQIADFYRSHIARLLLSLDVTNVPASKFKELACKVEESGSHLPRAVLAYFFALLHTIQAYSTSTFCPLVLDSPKQQDQDDTNWTRILECIHSERPKEAQLILATTGDEGYDFGGNVIELGGKNNLLLEEEFEDVRSEVMPLVLVGLS